MARILLTIAAVFFLVLPSTAGEKAKQKLKLRALGFRAIPWSNTSIIPGETNTECYGSGTEWGNTTDVTVKCNTVVSPDIPLTVSKLFVYNLVESAEYRYLISCTRNWIGSKCTPMIVGEIFDAEESGGTMNVYAYMNYNDKVKGKLSRVKFDIQNKTPKESYQIATSRPSFQEPKVETITPSVSPQVPPPATKVWNQEPTSFRGVNFGMTYAQAIAKEAWIASECPTLSEGSYCSTEHFIGSIKVKSHLSFKPEFTEVLVEFSPENFELMKAIFIEKYGKPHAAKHKLKANEPDTEAQNEILIWHGETVSVSLKKYFGDNLQKSFGKNFQSTALISMHESIKKSLKEAANDF